mmetsp:Transcript_30116/g.35204  ORF Transcript_30116/g.35204 Transcript_30116/m.35204 type:complete len:164 (-) Transcript_30116:216-707(-)
MIFIMAWIRLLSLTMRISWRSEYEHSTAMHFPETCGAWALESGCTRVSVYSSGCVDEQDIPDNRQVIFYVEPNMAAGSKSSIYDRVNKHIEACVSELDGSYYMGDEQLFNLEEAALGRTLHWSLSSFVWGFISDIYVKYEPWENSYESDPRRIPSYFAITIQN